MTSFRTTPNFSLQQQVAGALARRQGDFSTPVFLPQSGGVGDVAQGSASGSPSSSPSAAGAVLGGGLALAGLADTGLKLFTGEGLVDKALGLLGLGDVAKSVATPGPGTLSVGADFLGLDPFGDPSTAFPDGLGLDYTGGTEGISGLSGGDALPTWLGGANELAALNAAEATAALNGTALGATGGGAFPSLSAWGSALAAMPASAMATAWPLLPLAFGVLESFRDKGPAAGGIRFERTPEGLTAPGELGVDNGVELGHVQQNQERYIQALNNALTASGGRWLDDPIGSVAFVEGQGSPDISKTGSPYDNLFWEFLQTNVNAGRLSPGTGLSDELSRQLAALELGPQGWLSGSLEGVNLTRTPTGGWDVMAHGDPLRWSP